MAVDRWWFSARTSQALTRRPQVPAAGQDKRCLCSRQFSGYRQRTMTCPPYVGPRIGSMLIGFLMLFSPLLAADALRDLMQALAMVEHSEVGYQEEKHLAILDLPLLQSGRLNYVAPDQFVRTLDGPAGERFLVHGDQVSLEKKRGRETYDLNSLPMVKAFVASFGATLAGDLPRLKRYYEVRFSGEQSRWQLDLHPRDSQLASYIEQIKLWGHRDKIIGVEIHETNGDWSRMILLHD